MPLKLDIRRKLSTISARVKSMDLHPTEPWMLTSLFSGQICIWNYESQTKVKSVDVCDVPVRAAKFVSRKNWIVCGSDDMTIRIYNYNTLEKVREFEAHSDFIRGIAVHPTQPYILTCSDDMLIKLWNWEKGFVCTQIFEGHYHYVMQVVINPKDNNTFASASLDRTVKVWQLGSSTPNFTLEGHEGGVNCVGYYHGGDKPYLISGSDDRRVKIWDYQSKACVQSLKGHAHNVSAVAFHPELPLVITGSEDGTIRIWHANTYRLEHTLDYGLDRVWYISVAKGLNIIAMGYDEGSVMIKIGRDEPAISMDGGGKIIWAKHSEIQQANIKAVVDQDIQDGSRLSLATKELGSCEIYPQMVQHNPNGRFVVVCGDGEYIVYTAMALRNKSFGTGQEFVWASDSSMYAVREISGNVKIFKNFKEVNSVKPDFGIEAIFGGHLVGVRTLSSLAFYDWEAMQLIRRIEAAPKLVLWNESSELLCLASEGSYYILRYHADIVERAAGDSEAHTEDGIEDAFEVITEIEETVRTGCWVGDCFVYTNSVNRLNYYVGGEIVTIAHLDRVMYLLGYLPKDNRLFLSDKDMNIVSYCLLLSVVEYQTAVMRRDFETADRVLPMVPRDHRSRVAHFLEKQGFKTQALAVTMDLEHKFELAVQLGELKTAFQLAKEAESQTKWKQLAELATSRCEFGLAQECLHQAGDYGGLLLMATSAGNAQMVAKLGEAADLAEDNNIAFVSYFMVGKLEESLEVLIRTKRLPEAAFFARTYLPSQISRVVSLWKEQLSVTSMKTAQSLADPSEYENLFPGMQQSLKVEQFLQSFRGRPIPAQYCSRVPLNEKRNPTEEMQGAEAQGSFSYMPPSEQGEEVAVVSSQLAVGRQSSPATTLPAEKQEDNAKPKSSVAASTPMTPAPSSVPQVATPAAVKPAEESNSSRNIEATLEELEKELDLDLEQLDDTNIDPSAFDGEDLDWE